MPAPEWQLALLALVAVRQAGMAGPPAPPVQAAVPCPLGLPAVILTLTLGAALLASSSGPAAHAELPLSLPRPFGAHQGISALFFPFAACSLCATEKGLIWKVPTCHLERGHILANLLFLGLVQLLGSHLGHLQSHHNRTF